MPELLTYHPLIQNRDPALTGTLWLKFIAGFPEQDPTPLTGKPKIERQMAQQALKALQTPGAPKTGTFSQFEQLHIGRYAQTDFLKATRGSELLPFFKYFEAAQNGQNQTLHRVSIYGSYLSLMEKFRAYAQRLDKRDTETVLATRGRATELIAGALIARLQHPNITLVPSLALQDSFGIPADNHDHLYIDTFGSEPIVQPVQIKSSIGSDPNAYRKYFDSIALVFGDLDMHICAVAEDGRLEHKWADCLIENTMGYLIQEDTPQKTAALDTLTANLLIKLSTWQERKAEWLQATHEHMRSNKAARQHKPKRI